MKKALIITAAIIAYTSAPAFAGVICNSFGDTVICNEFGGGNRPSPLGRSSLGGERRGIWGMIDAAEHGQCWEDRRTGRTVCEK